VKLQPPPVVAAQPRPFAPLSQPLDLPPTFEEVLATLPDPSPPADDGIPIFDSHKPHEPISPTPIEVPQPARYSDGQTAADPDTSVSESAALTPASAQSPWDPPVSSVVTGRLDALRRPRRTFYYWLVPIGFMATLFGWLGLVRLTEVKRQGFRLGLELHRKRARPAAGTPALTISSEPAGAEVWIDREHRGETPLELDLPPGTHTFVLVSQGHRLWRKILEVPGGPEHIDAELEVAQLPPTMVGDAGLKVHCNTEGELRLFVDGVDSGRQCPNEHRIPLQPGQHRLSLYSPKLDRAIEVQKRIFLRDHGPSTRIYLKY
jgi:hypothetical protein